MAGNIVRITGLFEDKISGPLAKARDQFDRLGKSKGFMSVAQGVGMGVGISAYGMLTSAIGTAVDAIGGAIDDASNLNETLAKSSVIFGQSADEVEEWGETLATGFGISKQAGIEAAASFGNVFVGLGKTEEEASQMSQTLVELAGDLASFNNLATDDALTKLRAGLAGEAEPLRRVGVFLTEAKVKAKAMQLGFKEVNGTISESAKITARYQLILEETGTAQGDFARTADGLANSQRTLDAQLENLSATVGEGLLPIVTDATQAAVGLTTAAGVLAEELDKADGETNAFAKGIGEAADALKLMYMPLIAIGDALFESQKPMADSKQEANLFLAELRALKRGAKETGDGLGDDLTPELVDLKKAAREADTAVGDLTDALVEELYGDTIRAGEEADLQKRIKELKKELADTSNRRDAKIIAGQIAEARAALAKLHLEQAKADGPTAMLAWLKDAEKAFDKDDKEVQTLIKDVKRLLGLTGQLPNVIRVKHINPDVRQHGGPVEAGEPYIVGEAGPEVFVPRMAGHIVPNDAVTPAPWSGGGMSGGGGSYVAVPIVLNLDGETVYRSVERRLVRDLRNSPSLTR